MTANHYFALIVPICGVLLGCAFVACWAVLRRHRYLLWLSAAYILPAFPLAAQTMMSNKQLASTSAICGVFYLAGLWAMAEGMAKKYQGTAHPYVAMAIGLVTLGLLYYFSFVTDQLPIRMLTLNVAMALMLLLGVLAVYRSGRSTDRMERVLRVSYLLFVAYSLIRPAIIYFFVFGKPLVELSKSPMWLLMLAINILLSLWFASAVLAATVRDVILEMKRERDRDPLTQLLNRRAFFENVQSLVNSPKTRKQALVVCDIDHFKQINDTLGHAAGDEVLKRVAEVLTLNVREGDLVSRFGGEEFVLLLYCSGVEEATGVANRIREQLSLENLPGMNRRLTASFGAVEIESLTDIPQALNLADSFLYHAKKTGRNKVITSIEEKTIEENTMGNLVLH